MGKPGARRLLEAVKKRRSKLRQKNIVNKLLVGTVGSQSKSSKLNNPGSNGTKKNALDFNSTTLTCLIQEKVIVCFTTHA